MKYKAEDFQNVAPDDKAGNIVIKLTHDERENLKVNAKTLMVSMNILVKRCLKDAGLLDANTKAEEEDDTEPLLNLGR